MAQQPVASDLNAGRGETVGNQVIAKLGSSGSFDIYNALGSCDLVIDLSGYYGPIGH